MTDIPDVLQTLLMDQISNSLNGIAVLDQRDVILYHNRAFASMLGFGDETKIGLSLNELTNWIYANKIAVTGDVPLEEWLRQIQANHRSTPFRKIEVELSGRRWLLLSAQVYENGTMIIACTDLTSIKQTELALVAARQELERQAMTDELTGLPNRRQFFRRLKEEFGRALCHHSPVCLAMMDLDFFKRINDEYGHPAGDAVLRHFSKLLMHEIREHDICGRIGGEEFAVIFPETDAVSARHVLERIRTKLQQHSLHDIDGLKYTFSAGIADLASAFNDLNQWISVADQALYEAKSNGRDRVMVR